MRIFGGLLFFKGNPQKVINVLEKQRSQLESELFIRKDFEETTLMPHRDEKVIKGLLYSLFEGELYRKGWRAPIGKRKRALPQSFESNREFYLEIGKDAVVLFGLKYMFDISSDKNLRLWLDVYAPIWHISENRLMHREEIDATLRELYIRKALLPPKHRYMKTLQIIKNIFKDEVIELEFCDGDHISFTEEMYSVSPTVEDDGVDSSFSFSIIDEPYLRFKYGFSRNPREVVRLKAYGYGVSARKFHIKAIIDRAIKEDFIDFFKKLRDGYRGNYARWPGFQSVTGVDLSFDESVDIIYLDSARPLEQEIQHCLLQASSESNSAVVTFLAVPELRHRLYYKVKAFAIQRRMPIQVILKDTLKKEPLEFTLMNIGVALYAKGGGIPWVLKSPLSQTRSLFVGISFHLDHESKNIYYGVMEIFDKFGKHLDCKIQMYRSAFNIRNTRGLYIPKKDAEEILSELIRKYNPYEIIFHKSAPFHKEEKEAIEKVCGRDILYSLVHIERSNPYRVYTEEFNFTPIRGTLIYDMHNNNRAILTTTGHAVLDTTGRKKEWRGIGTPRPLEIMLERNTTKHNLREINEQILSLTKLDWNTTEISIRSPITLKYSNKAANIAPYLKHDIEQGLIEITDLRFLI